MDFKRDQPNSIKKNTHITGHKDTNISEHKDINITEQEEILITKPKFVFITDFKFDENIKKQLKRITPYGKIMLFGQEHFFNKTLNDILIEPFYSVFLNIKDNGARQWLSKNITTIDDKIIVASNNLNQPWIQDIADKCSVILKKKELANLEVRNGKLTKPINIKKPKGIWIRMLHSIFRIFITKSNSSKTNTERN